MINAENWTDIVNSLSIKNKANWAAHVLSSNIEIINDIVKVIDKQTLIKNCLSCYSIDFSAQPDLDQVLSKFSIQELLDAYKKLENRPIQTAGALMWLLEDMDPELKWAIP